MKNENAIGRLEHLTFKGNHKQTRYGWLRLTPAYSVHLVSELLAAHAAIDAAILDPFCGTGTTALVCAERGVACDTTDINPFLVWLAQAKTSFYEVRDLNDFESVSSEVVNAIRAIQDEPEWLPPLHQIEKWWDDATLKALGRAMRKITGAEASVTTPASNLLKVAFCRTLIEQANVSFGHQSMSFKKEKNESPLLAFCAPEDSVAASWMRSASTITAAALSPIVESPRVLLCDARYLGAALKHDRYSCVISSPPYPNRMSYIRELRPYMYWLGYLQDKRTAGDLDWQAIGGTWGCATSNLMKWEPEREVRIPHDEFPAILQKIAEHSPLLSRYVHKYFYDMTAHSEELFRVVRPGGTVNYIVGNSKFYDVLLPVEYLFAGMFESVGFEEVNVRTIRKRTSKKELFEFVVSARKP